MPPLRLHQILLHLDPTACTSGRDTTSASAAPAAAAAPAPARAVVAAPVVFTTELPGCRDTVLSPEEILHFKEHGWIVKKSLIPSEVLAPIRDCIWPAAAALGIPIDRDDSATFTLPNDHGLFPATEPKERYKWTF